MISYSLIFYAHLIDAMINTIITIVGVILISVVIEICYKLIEHAFVIYMKDAAIIIEFDD